MNGQQLQLRGRLISEDNRGNLRLDDIWTLAKQPKRKSPSEWQSSRPATALIEELQQRITTENVKCGRPNFKVIYTPIGTSYSGTFAHPILAAAYAGHLSPKLEIEVREIWLRYRAGDATLADDILQRASEEENRWAGMRALGRSQRKSYTDTLKNHGVHGKGYMECTEAVYSNLLGGKSFELRRRMKLPPKANLRNELSADKLAYIMAAEALSSERIDEEERFGNSECIEASAIGARAIRNAIEADRRDRQTRLLP